MSMWEVQEAARVITESIDRDAKVIFGAVEDLRLKKGEIKVTVIASGFPESMGLNSMSLNASPSAVTVSHKEPAVAPLPEKKKVAPPPEQQPIQHQAPTPITINKPTNVVTRLQEPPEANKEEESEWDVPAFFRRRK